MKPLNHKERNLAFAKFLISGIALLAIFGYGIYSYSFIYKDINTNISADNSEIEKMMHFIDDADKLVEALDDATSRVDKNKFSVELNQLIVDEKSSFISTATLFSRIEDNYRNLIKSKEVLVKIGEESKSNCDEELEKYKEQIDDLEKQVEKLEEGQKDAGKDLRMVRSGLERIASDLSNIGNDFASRDWCKVFGGGGRDTYKNELKNKLSMMKNEILKQASSL